MQSEIKNNQCLYIELVLLTSSKLLKNWSPRLILLHKKEHVFESFKVIDRFSILIQRPSVKRIRRPTFIHPSDFVYALCMCVFPSSDVESIKIDIQGVCVWVSISARILWKKKKTFWTLSPIFSPPHTQSTKKKRELVSAALISESVDFQSSSLFYQSRVCVCLRQKEKKKKKIEKKLYILSEQRKSVEYRGAGSG